MQARIRLIVIISTASALAAAFVARSAAATSGGQERERAAIVAFDQCIQERFKDVDEGFGFRRIVKIGETPHRFSPTKASEMTAVRELERAGMRVILYLTGRRVLGPKPPASAQPAMFSQIIKGPALVTPPNPDASAPALRDLWDDGRSAMLAFVNTNLYAFSAGEWKFTARPVRATDATCLNCHAANGATRIVSNGTPQNSSVRVGDPLGVVMYGYRPLR
jgi:hypothetical protein